MEARVRGGGVFMPNILHLPALLVPTLAVNVHPNPPPQPGDVFIPEKKDQKSYHLDQLNGHLPLCAPQCETNQTMGAPELLCSL